jgi:hypothetical protein
LEQLASKYKVSERTIRRDLEGMRFVHKIAKHKEVTVQLDTTYWGRNFGLMVIKDVLRNEIMWHKYVRNETIAQYVEGMSWLEQNGFKIYGAVIDGMRGLAQALYPIPVQMCQFHQILITRRYLTQVPDRMLAHAARAKGTCDDFSVCRAFWSFWAPKGHDITTTKRIYDCRLRVSCIKENKRLFNVLSVLKRYSPYSLQVNRYFFSLPYK